MIDVPELDTIDFEALVEEGRGLIPRFAPEWTDHNLHDPGITLLDLLAWFVDQQVYRIGFVGDAHLDAFAALLGIAREAAEPARGLIWPRAGALASDQRVAAGTRAGPIEQPDLAFSVSHDIALGAAALARIEAHGPGESHRIRPDESGAIRLDPDTESIELGFDRPLPATDDDGMHRVALGLAFEEALPGFGGDDAALPFRADYRGGNGVWHRADLVWTGAPGAASGAALIAIASEHGPVATLRLDLAGPYPRRALPVRLGINVVPVVQIETLEEEQLGNSVGWPDLELGLGLGLAAIPRQDGTFPNRLVIWTVAGRAAEEWARVASFADSGPDDRHFVLDEGRGTVIFGNGVNGRATPGDQDGMHVVDRARLDVTQGVRGNLPAGVAWTVAHVQVSGEPFGRNLERVTGGQDAWSRDDLLTAMRVRARQRRAMLTDAEMARAATALAGFGVERAEVLARFLPALPARETPGARTLLLRSKENVEATDDWLDAIERELGPRRVLGERLSVIAVEPVEVDVEAVLLVAAGSDRQRIEGDAERRLRARLSATQREGEKIEPWPCGRPVTIAELEALLAAVEGVRAVTRLQLARAGEPAAAVSLPLARTEVAIAREIRLALRTEG